MSDYEIRQLFFDDGDVSLQKLVDLQNAVYGGGHEFHISGFKYRYLENPIGRVISFNAFYGEELVAHYACVPMKMRIDNRIVVGLLDIATVTHPNHRGKGLFKKLAQTTFEYAKNNGFEFVLGVANANSFPGYMKYFNFTFVGRLEVKFGFGRQIVPDGDKIYSVYWDKPSLEWRLKCGYANYRINKSSIEGCHKSILKTYMGTFDTELLKTIEDKGKKKYLPLSLYVGLGAKIKSPYVKVPKFIKHSPFNLIFMDLTDGNLPPINRDNIFFQLIDFDVA